MFNFALSIALRMEGPTSRPRARPRPANPSLFPTMHVMTKFTRRPESVIRWTMFTSRTSSSVSGNRTSTISGSRIGRLVLIASPRLVISPARTMRPSFVFGTQAERSRSGRAARASRRRPLPADVEDRFLQAVRGSPAAREIAGQVGRGQIPRPRGPTMLLELERLRGREHAVSGRLRDDQLHDRLPQRLSDHRPGL